MTKEQVKKFLWDSIPIYTKQEWELDREDLFVRVSYKDGSLPVFSGLRLFILDRSKLSDPLKFSEVERVAREYRFRFFFPLPEVLLRAIESAEFDEEVLDEIVKRGHRKRAFRLSKS